MKRIIAFTGFIAFSAAIFLAALGLLAGVAQDARARGSMMSADVAQVAQVDQPTPTPTIVSAWLRNTAEQVATQSAATQTALVMPAQATPEPTATRAAALGLPKPPGYEQPEQPAALPVVAQPTAWVRPTATPDIVRQARASAEAEIERAAAEATIAALPTQAAYEAQEHAAGLVASAERSAAITEALSWAVPLVLTLLVFLVGTPLAFAAVRLIEVGYVAVSPFLEAAKREALAARIEYNRMVDEAERAERERDTESTGPVAVVPPAPPDREPATMADFLSRAANAPTTRRDVIDAIADGWQRTYIPRYNGWIGAPQRERWVEQLVRDGCVSVKDDGTFITMGRTIWDLYQAYTPTPPTPPAN